MHIWGDRSHTMNFNKDISLDIYFDIFLPCKFAFNVEPNNWGCSKLVFFAIELSNCAYLQTKMAMPKATIGKFPLSESPEWFRTTSPYP